MIIIFDYLQFLFFSLISLILRNISPVKQEIYFSFLKKFAISKKFSVDSKVILFNDFSYHLSLSNCYLTSLTLYQYLLFHSYPAKLVIGVNKEGEKLCSHSWVEDDKGREILNFDKSRKYIVLFRSFCRNEMRQELLEKTIPSVACEGG